MTGRAETLLEKSERHLGDWWSECRDAYKSTHPKVEVIIDFLESIGIFDREKAELWRLRIEKCPGHADEGGRDWCAYGCNMVEINKNDGPEGGDSDGPGLTQAKI